MEIESFVKSQSVSEITNFAIDFLNHIPVGVVVIDEAYSITWTNTQLGEYFNGNMGDAHTFFEEALSKSCRENDKMIRAIEKVMSDKESLKGIHYHKRIEVNGQVYDKWFDLSLWSMKMMKKTYYAISVTDITHIKEKEVMVINEDHEYLRNQYISMDAFNEGVLNHLSGLKEDKHAYFLQVKPKFKETVNSPISEADKKDIYKKLHLHLHEAVNKHDIINYLNNGQFIVMLPEKSDRELDLVLKHLNDYHNDSSNFSFDSLIRRIEFNHENVKYFISNKTLHLEYFKWVNNLMKQTIPYLEIKFL